MIYSNTQKKILMSYKKRQELIQEAVQKDIVNVAENLGMELIRKGNIYIWKEHDSFVFDTRKNIFYWNSQGFGGNTIKLVELIKQCSFKEAISFLTEQELKVRKQEEIIVKPFNYTLKDSPSINEIKKYLKDERKISDETIDFFYQKGILSQANYFNPDTQKVEAVIVFKNKALDEELKGIAIQGIIKNDESHRPYVKKTMGDGFCATKVIIGNPPLDKSIRSKDNPLKLIAFEAPIDMMSYYELYKDKIGDCILLSMNGLKKGSIATLFSEIVFPNAPEEVKKDSLTYVEKYCEKSENIKIILAVDNDKAGEKFVNDFDVSVIPVVSHLPSKNENTEKMDWNEYLKQKKRIIKDYKENIDLENIYLKTINNKVLEKIREVGFVDDVVTELIRINPLILTQLLKSEIGERLLNSAKNDTDFQVKQLIVSEGVKLLNYDQFCQLEKYFFEVFQHDKDILANHIHVSQEKFLEFKQQNSSLNALMTYPKDTLEKKKIDFTHDFMPNGREVLAFNPNGNTLAVLEKEDYPVELYTEEIDGLINDYRSHKSSEELLVDYLETSQNKRLYEAIQNINPNKQEITWKEYLLEQLRFKPENIISLINENLIDKEIVMHTSYGYSSSEIWNFYYVMDFIERPYETKQEVIHFLEHEVGAYYRGSLTEITIYNDKKEIVTQEIIDRELLWKNPVAAVRNITGINTYIDINSAITFEKIGIELSTEELIEWNNFSSLEREQFINSYSYSYEVGKRM